MVPKCTSGLALCVAAMLGPNLGYAQLTADDIDAAALASAPQTVSCTLETGDTADCLSITVNYAPIGLDVGPFCPTSLSDAGGIWDWDGDNAGLYRIDGAFLEMLSDLGYTFFNDTGEVSVFDIRTEGPSDPNSCISASFDDTVEMTVLIPITPVMADAPVPLGTVAKVGLSLSGVPVFADAPSVLDTGHMPALDVCAGHIDPGGWYHYHGTATDLATVYDAADMQVTCAAAIQDAKAQFGYAFDGYAIMGSLEADGSVPRDLDDCGGHVGNDGIYHYHAQTEFPNLPTCLVGVQAVGNFTTTAQNGIGSQGGSDGRPAGQGPADRPDFAAIASRLGIDATMLAETLQAAGGPQADLADVAATLGVSENDLRAALPQR